jgi:sec-independent protein translocase protein TatB
MFDIGMSEIALTAVVALLVLGPERLPGAARTAGALLRKARQSWAGVRSEIERELAAEELKRQVKEAASAMDLSKDFHAATDFHAAPQTPSSAAATPTPAAESDPPHDPR